MSPRPTVGHIRRPQMLAAAAEMIYERGFADTRTSDIAERAGVSPPNVLYHFETKDALLEEALKFATDEWFQDLEPGVERLERSSEKIVYVVNHLVNPPRALYDYTLEIETWARALRSDPVRAAAEQDTDRYLDMLVKVIRDGQRGGEFTSAGEPVDLAMGLLAICDGFGVSTRLGLTGITAARAVDVILEYASAALGCDLTSSPPSASDGKRRGGRR
jgi:AcrR family transcriptional regulator